MRESLFNRVNKNKASLMCLANIIDFMVVISKTKLLLKCCIIAIYIKIIDFV